MPPGSPNPDPISDPKCHFPGPFSDQGLGGKGALNFCSGTITYCFETIVIIVTSSLHLKMFFATQPCPLKSIRVFRPNL